MPPNSSSERWGETLGVRGGFGRSYMDDRGSNSRANTCANVRLLGRVLFIGYKTNPGSAWSCGDSYILYYIILYNTILYYTVLYYTILYYTILYYTILYYTIGLLGGCAGLRRAGTAGGGGTCSVRWERGICMCVCVCVCICVYMYVYIIIIIIIIAYIYTYIHTYIHTYCEL